MPVGQFSMQRPQPTQDGMPNSRTKRIGSCHFSTRRLV
jgi:hypothetical protein